MSTGSVSANGGVVSSSKQKKGPFIIGVAGGTASGKVNM